LNHAAPNAMLLRAHFQEGLAELSLEKTASANPE
jgi:hypothetical protein